ncbi:unnamed protein product [Acanthoscelides obtectus]|uniref:Uncharacterized protein n=1 Tax=Acanthoscelides obtectus TaxID=200917 RepID=A0A9P0PSN2_ACAOB|nr:unnamed protein product [Acanthoscelides obtectus]CAK1626993.1 hypothetical protein AOBTE_LOCUS4201 [Acanthoscelides obtectus]
MLSLSCQVVGWVLCQFCLSPNYPRYFAKFLKLVSFQKSDLHMLIGYIKEFEVVC